MAIEISDTLNDWLTREITMKEFGKWLNKLAP